jgi:hypothetical protein
VSKVMSVCGEALLRAWLDEKRRDADETGTRLAGADEIRERLGDDCRPTAANRGSDGEHYLEVRVRQAALEWVLGAEPHVICAIYRDAVRSWLPYVEALDWRTPVEHRQQVGHAQARQFIEKTGGEVVESLPYGKTVRWYAPPVFQTRLQGLELWAAVLSADAELAQRVAAIGGLEEPDRYRNTFAMGACLVRGDDKAAEAYRGGLGGSYDNDAAVRPQRDELVAGVLRGDEEMLAAGLRATTARYRTMWSPSRYKKTLKIGPHWREPEYSSPEEKLRAVAQELLTYDWVLSEYALACMVLAVRRGLTSALAAPDLWSEWVPQEVVVAATGL